MSKEAKKKVFEVIQQLLKPHPVVIWGSGATVSFGLPTMEVLKNTLEEKLPNFENTNENLEIVLGYSKYENKMNEIRKIIWDKVNESDNKNYLALRKGSHTSNCFISIKEMIEYFQSTHPRCVNIITTNYDRVLEYVMSYYDITYTDGFEGRELSVFKQDLFGKKNIVNLIKVHGSLNWFRKNNKVCYINKNIDGYLEPCIIPPGNKKSQESFQVPYMDLIKKLDDLVDVATSFFVVGFGFNDKHLTPKIEQKVKDGTPIVIINKNETNGCNDMLKNAQNIALLQESKKKERTCCSIKTRQKEKEDVTIDGNYWQLDKFMEII